MKLTIKEVKPPARIVALDDIGEGVFIGDTSHGLKVLVIRCGNHVVYRYDNRPSQPWFNRLSGLTSVINPVEVSIEEMIVKYK